MTRVETCPCQASQQPTPCHVCLDSLIIGLGPRSMYLSSITLCHFSGHERWLVERNIISAVLFLNVNINSEMKADLRKIDSQTL